MLGSRCASIGFATCYARQRRRSMPTGGAGVTSLNRRAKLRTPMADLNVPPSFLALRRGVGMRTVAVASALIVAPACGRTATSSSDGGDDAAPTDGSAHGGHAGHAEGASSAPTPTHAKHCSSVGRTGTPPACTLSVRCHIGDFTLACGTPDGRCRCHPEDDAGVAYDPAFCEVPEGQTRITSLYTGLEAARSACGWPIPD